MLTVEQVAEHYGLRPDTIRRKIRTGELAALQILRSYRISWPAVWACEHGPLPRGAQEVRYRLPLMNKAQVADRLNLSVRTVERWIARGLPTRDVFGAVRINPHDLRDWLRHSGEVDLPEDWWH
jgi:excisionase family DNA binding protein